MFESVVIILTLVRVGPLVLLPFYNNLSALIRPGRDDNGRSVRGSGRGLCWNVPHIGDRDRRGVDDWGGPGGKQVDDLGRCVNSARPSRLAVTSDIRIIRYIESVPGNVLSRGGQGYRR